MGKNRKTIVVYITFIALAFLLLKYWLKIKFIFDKSNLIISFYNNFSIVNLILLINNDIVFNSII